MTIEEVIALSKAGYTKDDITRMMSPASPNPLPLTPSAVNPNPLPVTHNTLPLTPSAVIPVVSQPTQVDRFEELLREQQKLLQMLAMNNINTATQNISTAPQTSQDVLASVISPNPQAENALMNVFGTGIK